ncbi:MAG: arginine--tRNA ligase [Culicoidibacterales bacterium]
MVKQQLTKIIKDALENQYEAVDFSDINIVFQVPKDAINGDLSTNLAMQLVKRLNQKPQEIAACIIARIKKNDLLEDVQIAGAGFLNFYLKKTDIFSQLDEMIKQGAAFAQKDQTGKAVNIEYVSVNPTGDLHIGHARGAVYGDVLAAILAKAGNDVTKEYYINDAGSQIAKLGKSVYARYCQALGEDVEMIEDGYHGNDIKVIAQKMVVEHAAKIANLTEKQRAIFIAEYALVEELRKIKEDLGLLTIEHDVWFSERTLYENQAIIAILERLKQRGMTYELEGAVWLKSTEFGDDKDRVLVKSDGSYTYLTPDIAYHADKIERLGRENRQLIDILGGDHHGYVARMKAALQTLGYGPDILAVELIQMVRFIQDGVEVKMSKRTGNSITMRELIEEVGADAVRYFFSMRSCNTPLDFNMTLAKEQSSNNPVYYVQYAHARICSIIANAQEHISIDSFVYDNTYDLLIHPKEQELAKKLNQYSDVIDNAARRLEPFKLTYYVQELAAEFHGFYNAVKVIDPTNLPLSEQRLKLLLATRAILKSAFAIIGIDAPDKM